MIQLADHFSKRDSHRHSEWLRQRRWFIKAKQTQEERAEKAEQAEAEFIALAGTAIAATEIQLQEFQQRLANYENSLSKYDSKLDVYDEAVAHALLEQIARLDQLQADKQVMLDTAFELEDGRRVFRSSDGSFAVDEDGGLLDRKEVETQDIPVGTYDAETYLDNFEQIKLTTSEIGKLHKAQFEIDAAREEVANARDLVKRGRLLAKQEDITVDDLDDFGAELDAAMPKSLPNIPASAMKYVSGVEHTSAPSIKQSFAGVASNPEAVILATQTPSPAGIELGG